MMALILLAAIWAAFLLPPILRARAENRPAGSISDFRRQLRVLGRTSPAASAVTARGAFGAAAARPVSAGRPSTVRAARPGPSSRTVKRRRDVFFGLLVVMAGSLLLGALPQLRVLWAVHLLADLLFAGYVGALIYLRNLAAEREMKIRFLPTASAPEPAFLYRRSAN